jgi:hypothetical protein
MADVKMVFESVEEMANIMWDASEKIGESVEAMQKIAQKLGDGALLGVGGDKFVISINEKLVKKMQTLGEKCNEVGNDIFDAMEATRKGESTSKSRFM